MGEVEDVGERAEARRDDDAAGRKNDKLRRFVDENLDKISLALSDGGTRPSIQHPDRWRAAG